MKVYIVDLYFTDGDKYEPFDGTQTLKVFSTREKARNYIFNYNGEDFDQLWVSESELNELFKKHSHELEEGIHKKYSDQLKYDCKSTYEEYKEKLDEDDLRYILSDVLDKPVELIEEDIRREDENERDPRVVHVYDLIYNFSIEEREVE